MTVENSLAYHDPVTIAIMKFYNTEKKLLLKEKF